MKPQIIRVPSVAFIEMEIDGSIIRFDPTPLAEFLKCNDQQSTDIIKDVLVDSMSKNTDALYDIKEYDSVKLSEIASYNFNLARMHKFISDITFEKPAVFKQE